MLLRGDNQRRAELSELSENFFPTSEGPTLCRVLILQMNQAKTNQNGKRLYVGAIKNRNPKLCAMGALAQYLFWRWHMSGEPAPSFRRREDWYRIKLLMGASPTEEFSYNQQNKSLTAAFEAAGVTVDAVTHITRKKGLQSAEALGVPEPQVS